MARSLSSQKRMRQNTKRAMRNKVRKTIIKTSIREFTDAVSSKDAASAETAYRKAAKVLDRFACRHAVHPNTAARRKSRLARRLNALKAGAKN